MNWRRTTKVAIVTAYLEIYLTASSSFFSKNVKSVLIVSSLIYLFLDYLVNLPTAQTTALPEPCMIIDPVNKKGSTFSLWLSFIPYS